MSAPDPIRPATVDDLAAMNAMVLRAKAHWGYDAAFMAAATDELTHTKDELGPDLVIWEDTPGVPHGMAKISHDGELAHLDSLFVDPDGMGKGIGRALFSGRSPERKNRGRVS